MKINIVTSSFKKATRFLNISLLIFFLCMVVAFVSLLLNESEFMKKFTVAFMLASMVMIVIAVFLLILRQVFKKTIEVHIDQIEILYINSQVDVNEIKEKEEIEYFGNSLKISNYPKNYELTNTTTFELLKNNDTSTATNTSVKIKALDIPPIEIMKSIADTLR